MGKSKVLIPKKPTADPKRMAQAITNTLNSAALGAKSDFGVTVQTWADKPTFDITSPTPYQRQVATDDATYAFVNDGTRPHDIAPHGRVLVFQTPFRAKTVPNQILSRGGSKGGNVVFTRKAVHHPGTAPRAFDKAIAAKWRKQFATIMQRAIDSVVD